MKIYVSSSFGKKIKKLKKKEKAELDQEINKIVEDLSIGSEKKGDLRGIFVHKFKIQSRLFLLSYRLIGCDIELIMIGPHQNYYRDLKSYIKNRI